jgi:hypothetical protein
VTGKIGRSDFQTGPFGRVIARLIALMCEDANGNGPDGNNAREVAKFFHGSSSGHSVQAVRWSHRDARSAK